MHCQALPQRVVEDHRPPPTAGSRRSPQVSEDQQLRKLRAGSCFGEDLPFDKICIHVDKAVHHARLHEMDPDACLQSVPITFVDR